MEPYERPGRLPLAASFVIWACDELTPVEKIVWYHDWTLDQGGVDGAYMSNASMGERLALAPRTVEQTRNRLKLLGLHEPLRRRDARNLGWIATLPPECRPMSNRVAGAEAVRLARLLSSHIKAREAWRTNQRNETAPANAGTMHQPMQRGEAKPRSAATGGGREGPPSGVSEAQLHPAVTEDGGKDGALPSQRRLRMEDVPELQGRHRKASEQVRRTAP